MTKEREVCVISNIKKWSAFPTRLEKKKLMMFQENNVIHRLWTDVKVKEKLFRVLIDSEANKNFLHQYVINSLKIQIQSQKSFWIIQINRTHSWQKFICIEAEVNIIVHKEQQIIVFDVLEKYKYTMILRLSWLQKINFQINWVNHELCFINEMYKIMNQPEICLLKHEFWNHKITFLSEKTFTWKSLYSMSEDQLWEVQEYMNKNLKWEFIKSSKSLVKYSVLFISKLNDKKQLCVDYRHLNNIMMQNSYSLSLIKKLQKHLEDIKWFMKLDLQEAYYWIWIKKNDK